jgi:hypothetical protein
MEKDVAQGLLSALAAFRSWMYINKLTFVESKTPSSARLRFTACEPS